MADAAIRSIDDLFAALRGVSWGCLDFELAELRRIRTWVHTQQPVQPGDLVRLPTASTEEALNDVGVHPEEAVDRSGRGVVAELYLDPNDGWQALVVVDALRDRGDLMPGQDRVRHPVGALVRLEPARRDSCG